MYGVLVDFIVSTLVGVVITVTNECSWFRSFKSFIVIYRSSVDYAEVCLKALSLLEVT